MKHHQKALERLQARQRQFDALGPEWQRERTRPGSLNPRKSHSIRIRRGR